MHGMKIHETTIAKRIFKATFEYENTRTATQLTIWLLLLMRLGFLYVEKGSNIRTEDGFCRGTVEAQ
jgi:hypothetical protein